MKSNFSILSLFLLVTSLSLFQACSDIQGSAPSTEMVAEPEIPHMLPRAEGLGSPEERAQVAQTYDDQVAILRQSPVDAKARLTLASLFAQEARVTGEHPYYYPKALELLSPVLKRMDLSDEHRFQALYLQSSVLLSQHEFAAALKAGEAARQIFPRNAGIYGVLIDAQVELGNYEAAVQLSDKMVSMRPDLRSYSRISYLRELHGDPKGAIEAMKMAVSAGMPGYEQTSWCRVTLGQLEETYGSLEAAEMQYHIVLQERPEYPFAYAGLASVAQQRGELETAMEWLEKAIALIPEVGFFEQKSELLAAMGKQEAADALVPQILEMIEEDLAGGHIMDLELAQVKLDLAGDAEGALAAVKQAEAKRPQNLEVQKILAQVYAALGDKEKMATCAASARRTGWQDPALLALDI